MLQKPVVALLTLIMPVSVLLLSAQPTQWGPDTVVWPGRGPVETEIVLVNDDILVLGKRKPMRAPGLFACRASWDLLDRDWTSLSEVLAGYGHLAGDLTLQVIEGEYVLCFLSAGESVESSPPPGFSAKQGKWANARQDLWICSSNNGVDWSDPVRAIDPSQVSLGQVIGILGGPTPVNPTSFNHKSIRSYEVFPAGNELFGVAVFESGINDDNQHSLHTFRISLSSDPPSVHSLELVRNDTLIDPEKVVLHVDSDAARVFWVETRFPGTQFLCCRKMEPLEQNFEELSQAEVIDQIHAETIDGDSLVIWQEGSQDENPLAHYAVLKKKENSFGDKRAIPTTPNSVSQELGFHGNFLIRVCSTSANEVYAQRFDGRSWNQEERLFFGSASEPTITSGENTVLVTARWQDRVFGRLLNASGWGDEIPLRSGNRRLAGPTKVAYGSSLGYLVAVPVMGASVVEVEVSGLVEP